MGLFALTAIARVVGGLRIGDGDVLAVTGVSR